MKGTMAVMLVLLAAASLLGGCAGRDLIAARRVVVEPRLDRMLRDPPEVREVAGDLFVSGRLARGLRGDQGGHVIVTVIDPGGTTLHDVQLNYLADVVSAPGTAPPLEGWFRRALTRHGSYGVYSVRFPGVPPDGSLIKVRREPPSSSMGSPTRIELLGFPDCPHTPAMRANLRSALASVDNNLVFVEVNQEALPEDDARRGWPSPTVLVNGRELFDMPASTAASLGCRLYDGGVPSRERIAARLPSALPSTPQE